MLRVRDTLRVSFEIDRGDGGTVLEVLVGESVYAGEPEDEVLAENKIRDLAGGADETLGHFDWHRNRIRRFGSSVCDQRGSGV